ncbi:MAG: 6,7-dimethyl-8-ribityllumazine synthase [Rhizobiales bacterium]|nr:6,7-dimethyl-8-ribityllumazine synthase [Hyphomicrobiales bacterium]
MATQKIAYIQASWHANIVEQSRQGFGQQINDNIEIADFKVPGALEMPLKAQQLARTGEYDAIVCAAFVVDGGIYRHDFVSQTVLDGLMRVSLDESLPVLSVSLTPHNFQETPSLIEYFEKHFVQKGKEAANCLHAVLAD